MFKKIVFGAGVIFILFVLGNLLLLDWKFLISKQDIVQGPLIVQEKKEATLPKIDEEKSKITKNQKEPDQTKKEASVNSQVKEFFIPLGSGSTTSSSYVNLLGTKTTINSSSFSRIKEVSWSASLSVKGGNGEVIVQLYNLTDNHPVWYSEIRASAQNSLRVTSGKINLDPGEKTYQIQAKSTIGFEGKVEDGRIRIILE